MFARRAADHGQQQRQPGLPATLGQWLVRLTGHRVATILLYVAGVVILNTALRVVDDAVGTHIVTPGPLPRQDFMDNIGEASSEGRMCVEPMDAVYTWVNGSEEQQQIDIAYWQAREVLDNVASQQAADDNDDASPSPDSLLRRRRYLNRSHLHGTTNAPTADETTTTSTPAATIPAQQLEDQSSASRFEDHDELLYSLRSLEKFAPWVRRVYIVTNGQVPTWLDVHHPRVRIVPHTAIFPDASHLPTFSSPAIEAHLHRIPGLSKRFLYLNDDTFFGSPVQPDDFYSPTRGHRIFFSWPVPNCAPGCPNSWLSDGFCDRACNMSDCDWDNGDCLKTGGAVGRPGMGSHGYAGTMPRGHPPSGGGSASASHHGGGNAGGMPQRPADPEADANVAAAVGRCASQCSADWLGDGRCDPSCDTPACGFDGGDCSHSAVLSLPCLNNQTSSVRGAFRRPRGHGSHLTVPYNVRAFTVRLDPWVDPRRAKVESATLDDGAVWVRAATVVAPLNRLLVMVDWPVVDAGRYQTCEFRLALRPRNVTDMSSPVTVALNVTRWRKAAIAHANTSSSKRATDQLTTGLAATATTATPTTTTTAAPSTPQGGGSDEVLKAQERRYAALSGKYDAPPDHPGPSKANTLRKLQQRDDTVVDEPRQHNGEPVVDAAKVSAAGSRLEAEERKLRLRAARTKRLRAELEALRESRTWDAALRSMVAPADEDRDQHHAAAPRQAATGGTRRRLLDMFGDSLKYANKMLTSKFGAAQRKVPAHMVHLIDRDVVRSVWRLWPDEYDATSASKFRSKRNLQFGFLHFYYIIHAMREWTPGEFWDEMIDSNRNGVLDPQEVRRVALLLFEKEVKQDDLMQIVFDAHHNASRVLAEQLEAGGMPADLAAKQAGVVTGDDAGGNQQQADIVVPSPPPPTATAASSPDLTRDDDDGEEGSNDEESDDDGSTVEVTPDDVAQAEADVRAEAAALGIVVDDDDSAEAEEILAEAVDRAVRREVGNGVVDAVDAEARESVMPTVDSDSGVATDLSSSSVIRVNAGRRNRTAAVNHTAAPPPTAVPTPTPPPPSPTPWTPPPPINPDDAIVPLKDDYVRLVETLIAIAVDGPEAFAVDNSSLLTGPRLVRRHGWLRRGSHQAETHLTRGGFTGSTLAKELIHRHAVGKYKYTLENEEDITFFMVRDNETVVQHQMDHVLYKRNKFICINDNMNHSHPNHTRVVGVLHRMFKSYFPARSTFERSSGRNAFTRLSESELAELYSGRAREWGWTLRTIAAEGDLPLPVTPEDIQRRQLGVDVGDIAARLAQGDDAKDIAYDRMSAVLANAAQPLVACTWILAIIVVLSLVSAGLRVLRWLTGRRQQARRRPHGGGHPAPHVGGPAALLIPPEGM